MFYLAFEFFDTHAIEFRAVLRVDREDTIILYQVCLLDHISLIGSDWLPDK